METPKTMKTPEEMMAYFRSMPKKQKVNPYWRFMEAPVSIRAVTSGEEIPLDLEASGPLLCRIREFFRRYYESFHSEAQVLCVTVEDGEKLKNLGIPVLTQGFLGPFEVMVMALPQDNSMGRSRISEGFWQTRIVDEGIRPVARIHSHHTLDPYQSATDYSTLNSGTLEMVLGRIFEEPLQLCYWLDVPGTDTKAQTFVAKETPALNDPDTRYFIIVPYRFHTPEMAASAKQ